MVKENHLLITNKTQIKKLPIIILIDSLNKKNFFLLAKYVN